MTKPNTAHIAVVLDRSGSMSSVLDATIEGFNAFLSKQKETAGEATMTLVQFDDKYEVNYENRPLKDVPLLSRETFIPRGWTALLDAVGKTINSVGEQLRKLPESERPEKVIVVIQTDGQENKSSEFTASQIQKMIAHQREKYDWQFVFLGANIDAFATATTFSIPHTMVLQYNANNLSTGKMMRSVGASISSYRVGTTNSAVFNASVQGAVADDSVSLEDLDKLLKQDAGGKNP